MAITTQAVGGQGDDLRIGGNSTAEDSRRTTGYGNSTNMMIGSHSPCVASRKYRPLSRVNEFEDNGLQ